MSNIISYGELAVSQSYYAIVAFLNQAKKGVAATKQVRSMGVIRRLREARNNVRSRVASYFFVWKLDNQGKLVADLAGNAEYLTLSPRPFFRIPSPFIVKSLDAESLAPTGRSESSVQASKPATRFQRCEPEVRSGPSQD